MPDKPTSHPARPRPVFVGGTGRSGTTVVSRLIGEHSQFAFIPYEARFHAEPNGLPGVLSGRVTRDEFLDRMRNQWFTTTPQGRKGGLSRFVPQDRFDTALEAFAEAFESDRVGASRDLVRALFDPIAEEAGKPSWVEMTPRNVFHASTLLEVFPDMLLVHSARDGRDTAGSLVAKRWVADMHEGLRWWGKRLQQAKRGTREIPRSQLLLVRLELLVERDREATYARLLEFLGVEDEPGMRAFFESEMTPGKAHIGRWREQVPDDELPAFLDLHRKIKLRHRNRGPEKAAAASAAQPGAAGADAAAVGED